MFQDAEKADLARAKPEIDRLINPSVDVEARLAEIDKMAETALSMANDPNDPWALYAALRGYLFDVGPWNDHQPFSYDLDDPWGKKFQNRLLSVYMNDKRGNCITMPLLMLFVGQRMGLDLQLAHAPLHLLLKFDPKDGKVYNLEATSGGYPARLSHYRKSFPITDLSLETGIYLRGLTSEESLSALGVVMIEYDLYRKDWEAAIETGDSLLKLFPRFPYVMLKQGTAYAKILDREFGTIKKDVYQVPPEQRDYAQFLAFKNADLFERAEALGWVPWAPEGYER